jgi:hypothetical protein
MGSHIPSWAEEIVLLNINEIVTIPAKNLFILDDFIWFYKWSIWSNAKII